MSSLKPTSGRSSQHQHRHGSVQGAMKTYLEPEDVALLEKAATNTRDRLLIMLLFHLGCRNSEALGIEVQHVDLLNGAITIEHLKSRIRASCPTCRTRLGKSSSFCPKCGARVENAVTQALEHRRMRTLPVDSGTLALLKEFIEGGGPVSKNGKLLLFAINRHRVWQIVNECAKRAGLPDLVNPETGRRRSVSPHRLRDAFAVNAVKHDDSGDGLRLLQEHLGHTSFNTTAKYRKISGHEHREWYQRLWEKAT